MYRVVVMHKSGNRTILGAENMESANTLYEQACAGFTSCLDSSVTLENTSDGWREILRYRTANYNWDH